MAEGMYVRPEIRAKVNKVALKAGILARKLGVKTLYNVGADVAGVAGKALIKGYDVGKVRREIDQSLRWQAGVPAQFKYSADYATVRDRLFYGLCNAGKPIENGTPFRPAINSDFLMFSTAMSLMHKMDLYIHAKGLNWTWSIAGFWQNSPIQKALAANQCALHPLREDKIIEQMRADRKRLMDGVAALLNPFNWPKIIAAEYHNYDTRIAIKGLTKLIDDETRAKSKLGIQKGKSANIIVRKIGCGDDKMTAKTDNIGFVVGLQKGKTSDVDNDTAKPIENGTPQKKGWLNGISED